MVVVEDMYYDEYEVHGSRVVIYKEESKRDWTPSDRLSGFGYLGLINVTTDVQGFPVRGKWIGYSECPSAFASVWGELNSAKLYMIKVDEATLPHMYTWEYPNKYSYYFSTLCLGHDQQLEKCEVVKVHTEE
jgi:hypothetical protein